MTEITPCVVYTNVFLHRLLDDGAAPTTRAERREQAMLRAQAASMCGTCPLLASCLTDAVTRFDVAGFVAGTTRRQRQEIRTRLGIEVSQEDLDAMAGVSAGRQFDRHEIHRLRTANPNLPLSMIAAKIGCSVSTVKRHLRRIEQEGGLPHRAERPRVNAERVLAVAADVRRGSQPGAAA